jgi:hypothetical protein
MKRIKKSIAVFAACLMMSSNVNAYEAYFNPCTDEIFALEDYLGVEFSYNVFNALVESCEARQ